MVSHFPGTRPALTTERLKMRPFEPEPYLTPYG